jgi:probable F420-dependent oxidoreductase
MANGAEESTMHLGIFSYNTEYGARPDDLAKACEARGFESLWVGEHTHIPASRQTPYPGGDPLPKPYYHMADPFVSLMAAAAVTTTLKVGTGVSLIIEHDPIILAKTIATLDVWSNGRLLLGIGGGWNAEEMENHGTPFARRWKVLRERMEAMKAIWTEEEASYEGEFVRFERIISYPKPVQQPHPPILFGGATPQGRQRVVNYCDGWIPIDVLVDDLPAAIADLHRRAEEAGRDPATIPVSVFAFAEPNADLLKRYQDMDVERVVSVSPRRLDDALPVLDRIAEHIPAVR